MCTRCVKEYGLAFCLVSSLVGPALADATPAGERRWVPVDRVAGHRIDGQRVRLRCGLHGGEAERALVLSFVRPEVVRLHADIEGPFAANNAPRHAVRVVEESDRMLRFVPQPAAPMAVTVTVTRRPFALTIRDGSGRVRVCFREIALDARAGPTGAPEGWRVRLGAADGEAFYGFGERFNAVNQRGRTVQVWGVDAGMGSFLGIRATAYKNSPFYLSSRRYALFWDSSYRLDCDMAATRQGEVSLVADGPILDISLACHDDPKASMTWLSALTGKPLLPPRWAFGPWMGREAGAWARTGHVKGDAVGEMLWAVDEFRRRDIPHSAIYAEGPSAGAPRLYAGLKGTGIRVLGWHSPTPDQWSNVKSKQDKRRAFAEALLHRKDGSLFVVPRGHFRQGRCYFDFTHPKAIEFVRQEFAEWLKLGLAGTMVDDGDDVPIDAMFHNGQSGRQMHNRFHYDYHRIFHQVFREVRGDDFILFARAAGPGCQQFVALFAGDHPESFDGLESVIHGGLSVAASGFPFWGSDVGGLLPRPFEPLSEPVYLRWVAFAAFSPLMRCHGCSPREPWRFGDRAVAVYKAYAWLRMNLLPTIYSLAVEAHRTGVPLMRLGYLEFPGDAQVLEVERAYCFGPDLWFTPVTDAGATKRVYLPDAGVWTDLRTGQAIPGGRWVERDARIGREPLFLREGGLLLVDLDDRTLDWGRSMTSGKRRCVAASAQNRSPCLRAIYPSAKRAIEMSSSRDGDTWRLAADPGWPEVAGFVVYGPEPKRVVWAGRDVPKLDGPVRSIADRPAECWWYDGSRKAVKLIVRPETTGELAVVF